MADFAVVALYAAGLLGQSVALCRIAGLAGDDAALVVAAFVAVATTAPVFWRRLAPCHEMGLAMLAVGGLGMTLGWWVDLGCPGAGAAAVPCHEAASGTMPGAHLHLLSWMNAGMLALGLPAMGLALRREDGFAWRAWSGGGMLLLSAPAMVAGMLAGSIVAGIASATFSLPPTGARLLDWAAMNGGMLAAMPPAHALAHALGRRGAARARPAADAA